MSLINQMLKDLEQRRAQSLDSPAGVLNGITWSAHASQRLSSYGRYILPGVILVLAALASYLSWDRWGPRTELSGENETAVIATASVISEADITPPLLDKSKLVKAKKAIKKQKKITRLNQVKSVTPSYVIKSKNNSVVAKTSHSASQVSAYAESGSGSSDAATSRNGITKYRRPLNAGQRAELAYKRGYDALQNGYSRQAEDDLRHALSNDARHTRSREMLAGIYIKAGRLVEAGQLLSEGVRINPSYSQFAKLYARVLLEQNNVARAISVLERRLPVQSQDPDYYALLAALHQRTGNHLRAAEVYEGVLKVRPRAGVWWIGLGISLETLGKSEQARGAYEKAKNSGTLNNNLVRYTDNRLIALREIGYPEE